MPSRRRAPTPAISLREFLESTPIGGTKTLSASDGIEKPTLARALKAPESIAEDIPRIRLFCDGECTRVRTFDACDAPSHVQRGWAFWVESNGAQRFFLTFMCGDCKREIKRYALATQCAEEPVRSDDFPMWELRCELTKLRREVALPIKGGCEQEPAAAARN